MYINNIKLNKVYLTPELGDTFSLQMFLNWGIFQIQKFPDFLHVF